MFGGNAVPSLADIAAVTKNNDGNGYGDLGGGWWILVILLALFGCFGGYGGFGGGYGMNGYGGGAGFGFLNGDLWRGFDNQTVINKLDGLNSGICSLGYDQLSQMNGINTNIMQTGFGLQQAINNLSVANMQNTNALSTQLANCCCENRQGQADIKYAMATDTCTITNAINQAAQNIIQNSNANYRQLHDEHVQEMIENYKATIAQQAQMIQFANLKASQSEQNEYLIDRLQPCAKPAYLVCNPYTNQVASYNNAGCCGQQRTCA